MRRKQGFPWKAAGLGAVAGARSMLAPALMSDRRARPGVARALALGAALEMIADKWAGLPARTAPLPLAARALSGLVVGALAQRRRPWPAALAGATTAVLAAFGARYVRGLADRRLGVPNALAGLVEDGLALAAGCALRSRVA